MGRMSRSLLLLAASALAALSLAACGGADAELLPGETAQEITENLERVEALANEGDCFGAEEAAADVVFQVEELQVDARLQEALSEGVSRLSDLVAECEEEPAEEEDTTETTETTEAEPEEPEEERRKPGKGNEEAEQPEEREEEKGESEEAPPSEEEKGKSEEAPPSEPESPSGGIEPAAPAQGE